jgi:TPR repeat protein
MGKLQAPSMTFRKAIELLENKDYDEAYKLFQELYADYYVPAISYIGYMTEYGLGTKQSFNAAYNIYILGAKEEDSRCYKQLFLFHLRENNISEAFKFLMLSSIEKTTGIDFYIKLIENAIDDMPLIKKHYARSEDGIQELKDKLFNSTTYIDSQIIDNATKNRLNKKSETSLDPAAIENMKKEFNQIYEFVNRIKKDTGDDIDPFTRYDG